MNVFKLIYMGILILGIGILIGMNVAHAAVGASYSQVTKGLSPYINLTESAADNIFMREIHYGSIDNNEISLLVQKGGDDAHVQQVMMVFMEGAPTWKYDAKTASKYATLVSNINGTVMANIFPKNDTPLIWARNCRGEMLSGNVAAGKMFKKTFGDTTVQVYRVFIPLLKRGFNVVSIT